MEEEGNRNVGAMPCSDVLYKKKQAAVGKGLQTGVGSGGVGFIKLENKTHAAQSGP